MKKKDKKQEKQIVKSTKIMNVYWFWWGIILQPNQFWVFFFSARSSTFLTASLLSTFMLSHPSQTVVWTDIDLHRDSKVFQGNKREKLSKTFSSNFHINQFKILLSRSRKWKTGHLALNQKQKKPKKTNNKLLNVNRWC